MQSPRRGHLMGFTAYLLWGFFPPYFKLLHSVGPVEILAHRIVWSAVLLAMVHTLVRRWPAVLAICRVPRKLAGVVVAAVLIAVNWGVYIYAVTSAHIVESSLGYFINPLVTVLLAVLVLGERLRGPQWIAVATGVVAVAVLTVDYGRLPWIALTLAVSFACYGLTKKRLALPAAEGLLLESTALTLPAAGYLGWLAWHGTLAFGSGPPGRSALLVLSGAVTAVPLLCFASAANSVRLSTLGLLQYLTPCLQLGFGVLVYGEPMPPARRLGFALVWAALAVFSWDAVRHSRRSVTPAEPPDLTGQPEPTVPPDATEVADTTGLADLDGRPARDSVAGPS